MSGLGAERQHALFLSFLLPSSLLRLLLPRVRTMDVNLHHHDPSVGQNKRTSIHELLNPVGPSLSDQYAQQQQLPSLSHFMPQPHPQHVQAMPPPQYSSSMNSQPFGLRAASWGQQATKDDLVRRPEGDPNACRFSPPSVPSHHQYYQDSYPRASRSVDETPSYAIEPSAWSTASEQANTSYPMYPNDRTGTPWLHFLTRPFADMQPLAQRCRARPCRGAQCLLHTQYRCPRTRQRRTMRRSPGTTRKTTNSMCLQMVSLH